MSSLRPEEEDDQRASQAFDLGYEVGRKDGLALEMVRGHQILEAHKSAAFFGHLACAASGFVVGALVTGLFAF